MKPKKKIEVINFVGDRVPFPLLLGNTWIEEDKIRRKIEEEDTEKTHIYVKVQAYTLKNENCLFFKGLGSHQFQSW